MFRMAHTRYYRSLQPAKKTDKRSYYNQNFIKKPEYGRQFTVTIFGPKTKRHPDFYTQDQLNVHRRLLVVIMIQILHAQVRHNRLRHHVTHWVEQQLQVMFTIVPLQFINVGFMHNVRLVTYPVNSVQRCLLTMA